MGKYNVIYCDPPWKYSDKAGKRGADKKYAVMSMDALSKVKVADLAADNCACFMWVTGPFMEDGLRLLKGYGFTYKNIVFTWVKENMKSPGLYMGMGHYSRANCEYVLLGMKGKLERKSKSVRSVVMAKRGIHSAKPDAVRNRIVELFGDIPRVELYARSKFLGWTQTGLEMDGLDVDEFIRLQKEEE